MDVEIPYSGLTIYQTSNSFKEVKSVKWLDNLFCRIDVKPNFSIEDKKPDIDGTFEILKNSRFAARLEVQIKTYNSKSSKNKPQYACDTNLLFYALKNRISCILLFVVDQPNNIAYWKYLSESYVKSLDIKPNQKSITIKFEEGEFVNDSNFHSCINKWSTYYSIKNNGIFIEGVNVEESIKIRKRIDKYLSTIDFGDIKKEDIICIQRFIDRFNYLLDHDYNIIKRLYYPDVWKMGIAIGEFKSNSLSYMLYPVFYGKSDLLIKKIKLSSFEDVDYLNEDTFIVASFGGNNNSIIDGSDEIIMNHINEKIKNLIEGKKFLYQTPEICIEYVFDALRENFSIWKIDYNSTVKLLDLKEFLRKNYFSNSNERIIKTYSRKKTDASTVYKCIDYLLQNEIYDITDLYPPKPMNDGLYIDYIYTKLKVVYSLLPKIFSAYMYYAFPSLALKINFWNGYDLVSFNLEAHEKDLFLKIFYFKRMDGKTTAPLTIFAKNYNHTIYNDYFKDSDPNANPFQSKYSFKGINYKLCLMVFDDLYRIKNNYSLNNQLYRHLMREFDNYLKPKIRIRPDSISLGL